MNVGIVNIEIQSTIAGKPSDIVLANGVTDGDTLPESPSPYENREIVFDSPFQVVLGVEYAIIVKAPFTTSRGNIRWLGTSLVPSYPGGDLYGKVNNDDWSPKTGRDAAFEIHELSTTPTVGTLAATEIT